MNRPVSNFPGMTTAAAGAAVGGLGDARTDHRGEQRDADEGGLLDHRGDSHGAGRTNLRGETRADGRARDRVGAARVRVLLLEDSDLDAELTIAALEEGGFVADVLRATDGETFGAGLAVEGLDLILSDYALPTYDGLRALKLAREVRPEVPFVFVSGALGEDRAVDSLQRGATDYVLKQKLERLGPAVRRAMELSAERGERRVAERKLSEVESRYRLLVAEVRDYAIIFVDSEGVVLSWNPGAARILGWEDDQIVGKSLTCIFSPDDQKQEVWRGELAIARETGRAADDRWLMRRDGSLFYASGVVTALRGTGGQLTGFVKILQDVTDRKREEEERARLLDSEREARALAETAGRAKDEFLAMLSHELRTPLSAILGWATLLRSGHQTPGEMAEGLEIIERNARSQSELIEDILDISRVISGKLRLNVGKVRLANVVEGAVEAISLAAQAKGIKLKIEVEENLAVLGDASRLQQVVWNLLSNAVKFTPAGKEVTVRVRRVPDSEGGGAEIAVIDGGMGIAPEFLPHVFERFRQADSSSRRRHGGLGLGLAIVRHLVELHGGRVEARSEGPGKGAEFRVVLPMGQEPSAADRAEAGGGRESGNDAEVVRDTTFLRDLRVLVVEDEPDVRRLMVALLAGYGARVTTAPSVEEGLAALESERPDVLLSDIGMPGRDGYELIRCLREKESAQGSERLPAAALTAYAHPNDQAKALESGFDRHVSKPVRVGQLVDVLAALLGK